MRCASAGNDVRVRQLHFTVFPCSRPKICSKALAVNVMNQFIFHSSLTPFLSLTWHVLISENSCREKIWNILQVFSEHSKMCKTVLHHTLPMVCYVFPPANKGPCFGWANLVLLLLGLHNEDSISSHTLSQRYKILCLYYRAKKGSMACFIWPWKGYLQVVVFFLHCTPHFVL